MKKIEEISDVLLLTQSKTLSTTQSIVLISILNNYSPGFDCCMLKYCDIAKRIGKHERTVYNSLMKLRYLGIITYERAVIRLVDEE